MSEKLKHISEDRLENDNTGSIIETSHNAEFETPIESEPENSEREVEQINNLREKLGIINNERGAESDSVILPNDEKIKQYQDRYLPEYLKKRKGIIGRGLIDLWAIGTKFEKEGEKNIPESGPFLVVCNHFGAGDVPALLKVFGEKKLHFAAAKSMMWDESFIAKWFLKQIKAIPVQESLSNLLEKEKEEALLHQGKTGRSVFRNIINAEKQGKMAINVDFIRQAVAVLSRGDALCIFPEGLWLNPEGLSREKAELKKAYGGVELIASQFKKLTGVELPILPTAFDEDRQTKNKKLIIGNQIVLEKNDSDLSGVDWCMAHIAEMLPEEKRGYYARLINKL